MKAIVSHIAGAVCCAFAAVWLGSGCVTRAVQRGDCVEIDQTVFGFNLSASSAPNELPAVQFGLIRSKVVMLPTSTNKLNAPLYHTDGELNNNGRTLLFGGADSTTAGESVPVTNKAAAASSGFSLTVPVPLGTNSSVHIQ